MRRWRRQAKIALGIELVLFVGLTIAWELSAADPHGALQLGILPMAVIAMALQASLARAMPQRNPSTTYLTGTVTAAVAALVTGSPLRQQQRRIGAVLGLMAGAFLATVLIEEAPRSAPILVIALLVTAFAATSGTLEHPDRPRRQFVS